MLSPREHHHISISTIHFATRLFCLIAWLVPGQVAFADSPGGSLQLGLPTQLMVQPYVSVDVLHETSPGVYENYGPSSQPETIDIFGITIQLSSAHNSLLLDTGANSILIVDAAAQDLEDAGYQTEGLFWEIGVGGYHEYEVSAPYRFAFTGSDEVTHYLDGPSGNGVRIQSNPDSVLAAPIASGGVAGLVGMPAMTGRVTTLGLAADGYEFPSGPIETWDIWELITLLASGTDMNTSFSNNLPAASGNRYTVPLDNRIIFAVEDGIPDGEPLDSPLPIYADVPFLTAQVNAEIDGVFREVEGTFLLDTGAQFSMISRRMAFALGLDENGNGNLDDEAFDFIEIAGVGGTKSVPLMSVDELRLPTEQGVDMVWYDPSDPLQALGVQFIVLDLFPSADIDYSGIVDATDIATIEANANANGNQGLVVAEGDIPSGDINSDGIVDGLDLAIAMEQLGETTFIDGIFGIDMITGGTQISGEDFNLELIGTPFFESVHFDFRNWESGYGTLVFDVNPLHATVTPGTFVLPGDANGDGRVDADDAAVLAANRQNTNAAWEDGDFNGDGLVDDADATILAANWQFGVPIVVPGDANGDGRVDAADAAILVANWQSIDAAWEDGDFNDDGIVDDSDATAMVANWQYGAGSSAAVPEAAVPEAAVPEPGAAMLVALLCCWLIAARRRTSAHAKCQAASGW